MIEEMTAEQKEKYLKRLKRDKIELTICHLKYGDRYIIHNLTKNFSYVLAQTEIKHIVKE